jgi:hypothetical protein
MGQWAKEQMIADFGLRIADLKSRSQETDDGRQQASAFPELPPSLKLRRTRRRAGAGMGRDGETATFRIADWGLRIAERKAHSEKEKGMEQVISQETRERSQNSGENKSKWSSLQILPNFPCINQVLPGRQNHRASQ